MAEAQRTSLCDAFPVTRYERYNVRTDPEDPREEFSTNVLYVKEFGFGLILFRIVHLKQPKYYNHYPLEG